MDVYWGFEFDLSKHTKLLSQRGKNEEIYRPLRGHKFITP